MLIFLITILTACKAEEGATNNIEETMLKDPIGMVLQTVAVSKQDIYKLKAYNGEVNPSTTELYFPFEGTFLEYCVSLGSHVSKGTIIAKINDKSLLDKIDVLEKNYEYFLTSYTYEKAKKENDLAISNYDLDIMNLSLENAYKNDHRSYFDMEYLRLQIDDKKASIERKKIQLNQYIKLFTIDNANQQRNIETLKKKLGINVIVAPFDGTVISLQTYKTGDYIDATKPVVAYADTNNLVVQCEYISETIANSSDRIYARIGDKEYNLTYIPYDPAVLSSMKMKGETPISTFTIDNMDDQIQLGMFAIVIVISDEKTNVLSVPASAIYRDSLGTYVSKIIDNVKTKVNVEIGISDGYNTEILDGLLEGDVVYVGK